MNPTCPICLEFRGAINVARTQVPLEAGGTADSRCADCNYCGATLIWPVPGMAKSFRFVDPTPKLWCPSCLVERSLQTVLVPHLVDVPVLDEHGNPVLDEGGRPTYKDPSAMSDEEIRIEGTCCKCQTMTVQRPTPREDFGPEYRAVPSGLSERSKMQG